jgi:hypothetical protein
MKPFDSINSSDFPPQPLFTPPSSKAAWVHPRISKLEASCTAGDAKASKGNEATPAEGPS